MVSIACIPKRSKAGKWGQFLNNVKVTFFLLHLFLHQVIIIRINQDEEYNKNIGEKIKKIINESLFWYQFYESQPPQKYLFESFDIYIKFYSVTTQMFLRAHDANLNFDDQAVHPDLLGRILYFVPTYLLLLIISFFFHRKSITAQLSFPIYPLPNQAPQNFIYYTVVVFMGIIGVYITFGNYWTAYDWILYAVANILLSVYVFLYQVNVRFTLLLTSIAALLLAVNLQWLFIETSDMGERNEEVIIRNLIGAVGAWGLIYALMTIGQFFVHTIGFNKTFQSIGFFIAGILLLFGIAFWNKKSYCGWTELIGFISVGALLLIFCASNTRRNSSLDLQNLLS